MRKILLLSILIISKLGISQKTDTLSFIHDDKRVYGTLRIPAGSAKPPLIIINPGSGANDRDGTINIVGGNFACLYPGLNLTQLKPYKELALALVDSGYAVFTYDKLEYTYKSNFGIISFHKIWLPVESAINFLKKRSDIDSNKIILIGHSEGSSIIPFISKSRKDIKALISIAGPRTPLDSLINYQYINIARTCKLDTNTYKYQGQQVLDYFDIVRKHKWNANTPPYGGVDPQTWYDYTNATDSVAINYNLNQLPTLFIGFENDINVPPPELDRFKGEITTTQDFWRLPDIVHYMVNTNSPHVPKSLTDTIIYWLRIVCPLITKTAEENSSGSIKMYPNPTSTDLFIQNADVLFADKFQLKLLDLSGNNLFTLENQNPNAEIKIPIQNLQKGMYFILINDGKGKKWMEKFVKI